MVGASARQVAQGLEQVGTHLKVLDRLKPLAQRVQPTEVQVEQLAVHGEQPPVELL